MFKRSLQIIVGIAFVAQLAGCFFVDRDRRGHYDHDRAEGHEYHDHDPSIDVHLRP